jgi:hypothetical protein
VARTPALFVAHRAATHTPPERRDATRGTTRLTECRIEVAIAEAARDVAHVQRRLLARGHRSTTSHRERLAPSPDAMCVRLAVAVSPPPCVCGRHCLCVYDGSPASAVCCWRGLPAACASRGNAALATYAYSTALILGGVMGYTQVCALSGVVGIECRTIVWRERTCGRGRDSVVVRACVCACVRACDWE